MDASAEDLEEREAAVETVLRRDRGRRRPAHHRAQQVRQAAEPRARAALQEAPPGLGARSPRAPGDGLDELEDGARRRAWSSRRARCACASRRATRAASPACTPRAAWSTHEVEGDEVHIEAELPERLIARYREHLVG